jgi:hypothetical protein
LLLASSAVSKPTLEAERAALLAEYRLLMQEQDVALRTPDDIAAKRSLVDRLADYQTRFAAFRQRVEQGGSDK